MQHRLRTFARDSALKTMKLLHIKNTCQMNDRSSSADNSKASFPWVLG
jgi:hypothetical protein